MKIAIVNGPNLNLLGTREPEVYGKKTFETFLEYLIEIFPDVQFNYLQSNIEVELINAIQEYGFTTDGIILNPAGYTHTSVAIGDAVAAVPAAVVEVHISNIFAREEIRKHSHVSAKCAGVISGLGLKVYELAVRYLIDSLK